MKKILLFLVAAVAVIVGLLTLSGDVRSIIGWALTGYLVVRAFPGVRSDLLWFARVIKFRNLRYRTSKVDTL